MFVSAFFKAEYVIALGLALSLLGVTVSFFAALGYLSALAIWIGTFLTGFGLAPIVPSSLVWTNQVSGLSAVQAAVIAVGMFAGFGLGPMTTSILLKTFGFMTMIYILFIFCFIQVVLSVALNFIDKQLKKLRIK